MAERHVAITGNDTTGDGSIENPYRTPQRGVTVACAGDDVIIHEGRYEGQIVLNRQGTEGNPITIKPAPGDTAILDGSIAITGWQQCQNDDTGLIRGGIIHANYASIYKTTVTLGTPPSNIFENSEHCRMSRWPDQLVGYGLDTSLFYPVPTEAYGYDEVLVDNLNLSPTNEEGTWYPYLSQVAPENLAAYFNGAILDIHLLYEGNYKQTKTITGYSGNAIQFAALRRPLMAGDKYSILNHPHALSGPGEFFYIDNGDGTYTIYLWPSDVDNLTSNIRRSGTGHGIRGIDHDYITIDGLRLFGYSGRGILFSHETGTANDNTGVTIQNCTVTDCGEDGIYIWVGPNAKVLNCTVERVGSKLGAQSDRGIMVSSGSNVKIADCSVRDTVGTCISGYGIKTGQFIRNKVYGTVGVHANGISVYVNSENILIAHNQCFNKCNIAVQDITNVLFFGNILDGFGSMENIIATWPDAYGGTHGWQYFINNTVIRCGRCNSIIFRLADPILCYNNLISGSAYWNAIDTRQYNGWMGRWTDQRPEGWVLGTGEWQYPAGWMAPGGWTEATQSQYNGVFRDLDWDNYTDFDYGLAAGDNPAVHSGINVQTILENAGITALFPDFDFTKDIAGNTYAAIPSLGAYEYAFGVGPITVQSNTKVGESTGTITLSCGEAFGGDEPYSYQWQRSTNGTDYVDLEDETALTLEDSGLVLSTTYYYRMRASDNNNESVYAQVTVTTLDAEIPPDIKFPLTVHQTGLGIILRDKQPDSNGLYNEQEVVTLTAHSALNSKFTGWSGDAEGTQRTLQITMDEAKTIHANFATAQRISRTICFGGKALIISGKQIIEE